MNTIKTLKLKEKVLTTSPEVLNNVAEELPTFGDLIPELAEAPVDRFTIWGLCDGKEAKAIRKYELTLSDWERELFVKFINEDLPLEAIKELGLARDLEDGEGIYVPRLINEAWPTYRNQQAYDEIERLRMQIACKDLSYAQLLEERNSHSKTIRDLMEQNEGLVLARDMWIGIANEPCLAEVNPNYNEDELAEAPVADVDVPAEYEMTTELVAGTRKAVRKKITNNA